jgi:hypothetical protein
MKAISRARRPFRLQFDALTHVDDVHGATLSPSPATFKGYSVQESARDYTCDAANGNDDAAARTSHVQEFSVAQLGGPRTEPQTDADTAKLARARQARVSLEARAMQGRLRHRIDWAVAFGLTPALP